RPSRDSDCARHASRTTRGRACDRSAWLGRCARGPRQRVWPWARAWRSRSPTARRSSRPTRGARVSRQSRPARGLAPPRRRRRRARAQEEREAAAPRRYIAGEGLSVRRRRIWPDDDLSVVHVNETVSVWRHLVEDLRDVVVADGDGIDPHKAVDERPPIQDTLRGVSPREPLSLARNRGQHAYEHAP